MSNQIIISSGAKVRSLEGVLTGTSGVVDALGINVPSGIPQLDSNGKILVDQLPNSVMEFKGTWNVSTNTPYLVNGVGNAGDVYLVEGAATGGTSHDFGAGAITFYNGDQVVYSGSTWERASGSSGTVTSVSITESGDALNITGSPITNSGTINIGFNGTSGQYINGAGNLTTFPTLTGYVPYTGATGNVDLGEYGLSGGYLGLDTTPTGTPTSVGTLSWDSFYKTPQVVTGTGNTTLQIGQEEVILIHNGTGSTLTDGQVVYVTGSTGELPSVSLADASSETTSAATLGVVTETIANGSDGFVTVSGIVHGLNTLAYTEGDLLWLSETAGEFTNVKPISPAHLVLIGYVIKKAGGNGSILVKIQNTQELAESSDVLFTSLANNDGLFYESSTGLWKNKTIANVLGYTPANAATYVPYTGATSNVDLGSNSLTGGLITGDSVKSKLGLFVEGYGGEGYSLAFKQYTVNNVQGLGYTSIGANSTNILSFYFAQSTAYNGKSFKIDVSGLTDNVWRTYQMPNADGTLALTSDIPSLTNYVTTNTLQTITGIKNFTNEQLFGNGIALTGGFISYEDSGFNLTLNTNTLTANRNVFLQDGSGTLAFTSDLSAYLPLTGGSLSGALSVGTNLTVGNVLFGNSAQFSNAVTASAYYLNGMTAGSGALYWTSNRVTLANYNSGGTLDFEVNGGTTALTLASTGAATFSSSVTATTGFFSSTAGNQLTAYYDASNYMYIQHNGINIAGNDLLFSNNAGTERMRIKGGNVGIGTSSPTDFQPFGYGPNIEAFGGRGGGFVSASTSSTYKMVMSVDSSGGYGTLKVLTNHPLMFATNDTERMRIDSSGNVGIGSPSVGSKLYTYLGADGTHYRGRTIDGSNNPYLDIKTSGGTVFLDANGSAYGQMAFKCGDVERMRITSGGKVLTGTTDSSGAALFAAKSSTTATTWSFGPNTVSSLDIFRIETLATTGVYLTSGNTSWTANSDERLKNITGNIENAIDALNTLRTIKFSWKKDEKNKINLGLIAQDVIKVFPEIVDINDDEEKILGVRYTELVPVLIKAIQELSAKVTALENKI